MILTVVLSTVVTIQTAVVAVLLLHATRSARAQRELRKNESRLRSILDRAPAMIWTARPDTTLDYLNRTCGEFAGVPLDQLRDEGWLDLVHPEDRERAVRTYTPAIDARLPFTVEYRIRRADGAWRWFLASGVPRFDTNGLFEGYVGCDVDISERKDAEDRARKTLVSLDESHREVQQLAGRLIEAQDAERARLARDLHDDVSQQLAGLSIALSGLRHRLQALEATDDILDEFRSLHERATTLGWNVRHLAHDLHPTVLRHSGLVPALTTYCSEVERLHGMTAPCVAQGDFAYLPPEAALCLYRIAQEAVRNVIAHAAASRVEVRLHRDDGHTELTITDDGRGFDMASPLDVTKGLGLVSMTERARLLSGIMAITTAPGRGTSVRVRIPA